MLRAFTKSEKVFNLGGEKVPHPIFRIMIEDAVFFNYTDRFLNSYSREKFNDTLADYLLEVFHKDIQLRINTFVSIKSLKEIFEIHYAILCTNAIHDHSLFLGEISELMKSLTIKHYYVISKSNSEIILNEFVSKTMPLLYNRMISNSFMVY